MISSLVYTLSLWDSFADFGSVAICESSLTGRSGYMYIDLDLDIKCLSVGANQSLTFTPMLISDNCHQELPAIIIYGKERYKAYRKLIISRWMLSVKTDYNIYKIIEAKNGKNVSFSYSIKTPLESWMSNASIGFYDHSKGGLQTQ